MKRVIFTCFDPVDVQTRQDERTTQAINEYFDLLVENKKQYADRIGVDFIFYHNTMKDFDVPHCDNQFTKINLYKHHLMDQLADQYDQVMYVDMDVVFNTDENVFEAIDLSKGITVRDQDDDVLHKDIEKAVYKDFGVRNPTLKYHITKDLLNGKDNHVINTGVMIGKSEHIKQIKFVERLPKISTRIQKLKEKAVDGDKLKYVRNWYYPNNESIFSYILERYNIPYQLMDKQWHTIRDNTPTENLTGKVIHFINKRFVTFFQNKTKAVFSIYINIEDSKLDEPGNYTGDDINKSKRTQIELEKYKQNLIENKKRYCQSIGAEFLLYQDDNQYRQFRERFVDLSEYDIINLYKIYLLDQLTKQYDMVLYIDFDVYCRRNVDFFNYVPVETHIGCLYNTKADLNIDSTIDYIRNYCFDFRSPHSKYWNAHALLTEEGLDGENVVFNTGIVGATRAVMEKLDYFSDIDEVIETMKQLKQESIYPENISAQFGYDNETIFSYKVKKNKVPVHQLDQRWHYKHLAQWIQKNNINYNSRKVISSTAFEASMADVNPVLIHFISKQFFMVFDEV